MRRSHANLTTRRRVVFWGARGQARVLRELIEGHNFRLTALFDNDTGVSPPFADVPLHVGRRGFSRWLAECAHIRDTFALVAIGGARGRERLKLQHYMEAQGLRPLIARHLTAFVAGDATIGRGSQVLARATVCAAARLGEACIINTAASVDHECRIEDGAHIGPGATLCGGVHVGTAAFVGAGAVVLPNLRIGEDSIVGGGSVVTRDVPDGAVVMGNPARVARRVQLEASIAG